MEAFRRFDFQNDERWKAYLKSIEIPTGENDSVMLKLKAKWYKRTIDPDFDVAAVGSTPKPTSAPKPSATSSSAGNGTAGSSGTYSRPQAAPTPPPPSYGAYGAAGGGSYGSSSGKYGNERWQRVLFFMHVALLALSVFVLVPFMPYARLGYLYFMRLTIVTFAAKIYLRYGMPSVRPFSMFTAWFQRVIPTTDFLQVLIAVVFSSQPPMVLVAAPAIVLAAYHAAAYAAAHFQTNPLWRRYGSPVHAVMLGRQQDALQLNALCEVGTLFMLVLHLLTPARSFLSLMLYAQILKLKLHVPDSAPQHRQVWQRINDLTLPYRMRVPALERLVQLGVKWFMSVPGAR